MPRKNPRPAERKRLAKLRQQLQQTANYQHRARPYLVNPRHGDNAILIALAMMSFPSARRS